jgi:glycosyltransferase involved in cell wall biosynthesis
MKVSIILLDYHRKTYTEQVKEVNLNNAGHPFSLVTVDRKGIAAAFNEGIRQSAGHDAVVFMANDILMPDNWLATMVQYAEAILNTGIIGIHTVEALPAIGEINGLPCHPCVCPFGNQFIPWQVIDKIGGYNEAHDPYGRHDADFAYRAQLAGFVSYYLPNLRAAHVGHDVGDNSDYRRMKDAGLDAAPTWEEIQRQYDGGNYNIPIIEMQQYHGET